MKYIKQFGIILTISSIGELCNQMISLPIPASIYGVIILFAGLLLGWVKLDSVKETDKFSNEIMSLMFIPAVVGLLESWGVLRPIFVPVITITPLSKSITTAVGTAKAMDFGSRKGAMGSKKIHALTDGHGEAVVFF